MDFYIISTCTELGLAKLFSLGFPTPEHAEFIESILAEKNLQLALEKDSEKTKEFEQNGLNGLVSATEFFNKLRIVCERGSYISASIRMDVQISTRTTSHAPDCKLNMLLKTNDWERTFNMSTQTGDKLLDELQNARTFIRQNKAAALLEQVE